MKVDPSSVWVGFEPTTTCMLVPSSTTVLRARTDDLVAYVFAGRADCMDGAAGTWGREPQTRAGRPCGTVALSAGRRRRHRSVTRWRIYFLSFPIYIWREWINGWCFRPQFYTIRLHEYWEGTTWAIEMKCGMNHALGCLTCWLAVQFANTVPCEMVYFTDK